MAKTTSWQSCLVQRLRSACSTLRGLDLPESPKRILSPISISDGLVSHISCFTWISPHVKPSRWSFDDQSESETRSRRTWQLPKIRNTLWAPPLFLFSVALSIDISPATKYVQFAKRLSRVSLYQNIFHFWIKVGLQAQQPAFARISLYR